MNNAQPRGAVPTALARPPQELGAPAGRAEALRERMAAAWQARKETRADEPDGVAGDRRRRRLADRDPRIPRRLPLEWPKIGLDMGLAARRRLGTSAIEDCALASGGRPLGEGRADVAHSEARGGLSSRPTVPTAASGAASNRPSASSGSPLRRQSTARALTCRPAAVEAFARSILRTTAAVPRAPSWRPLSLPRASTAWLMIQAAISEAPRRLEGFRLQEQLGVDELHRRLGRAGVLARVAFLLQPLHPARKGVRVVGWNLRWSGDCDA